ncbi:MAG: hypothetical protein ACYCVV_19170 [Acidimicrobiales bacterium]
MTVRVTKHLRNGRAYYDLWDQKRVKGRVVKEYLGYLGTSPKSKQETSPEQLYLYVRRIIDSGLTSDEAKVVLKRMGLEVDITPIKKLIIENDLELHRLFVRVK